MLRPSYSNFEPERLERSSNVCPQMCSRIPLHPWLHTGTIERLDLVRSDTPSTEWFANCRRRFCRWQIQHELRKIGDHEIRWLWGVSVQQALRKSDLLYIWECYCKIAKTIGSFHIDAALESQNVQNDSAGCSRIAKPSIILISINITKANPSNVLPVDNCLDPHTREAPEMFQSADHSWLMAIRVKRSNSAGT